MFKKADVQRLTRYMDRVATNIQDNPAAYALTEKQAYDYALDLDRASDRLEAMVDIDRSAEVMMHDHDEDYMSTFDDSDVMEGDNDEPYMQHFEDDTHAQLLDHSDLTPGNSSRDADAMPWWTVDADEDEDEDEDEAKDASNDWRNW